MEESITAVGYRFVSQIPSSVSFYAVEVYGFFEAAEGGIRFLNAAKSEEWTPVAGCSIHHQRGDAVCTNDLLIRRDDLESRLLRRLQEAVLRDEVIDYAVERLSEELERRHKALNCQLVSLREEKRKIESEIANLVQAIAAGKSTPSVMVAIAGRERKIQEIMDRLIERGPESFQERLDELRTFAIQRHSDIRVLLGKPETVHEARALLAEQFGRFTLNRVKDVRGWSYNAAGSVDFFGKCVVRVDGAGGPDRNSRAYAFSLSLAA